MRRASGGVGASINVNDMLGKSNYILFYFLLGDFLLTYGYFSWQKLRQAEVEFEKGFMETSLDVLATQERELRKRMEEVNNPPDSRSIPAPDVKMAPTKPPAGPNGTAKPKVNGTTAKKGKKRKTDVAS